MIENLVRSLLTPIIVGAAFLAPMLLMVAMLHRMKKEYRARATEPFTQLPLRPPGESLRLAIEKLNEEIDTQVMYVAVVGGMSCVITTTVAPPHRWAVGITLIVITLVVTLWKWRKLKVQIRRLWDNRLGFTGERVVGEELNQLLAVGFRVFHDVPFDGFNIDHVLVGPAGVYAVETKTRRKPADMKGPEKATVMVDGDALTYPKGYVDRKAVEQTRRNARTLEKWLTEATGERTSANAILTLPGWWVVRRAVGDVNVLNPDEIKRSFPDRPKHPLSPDQIQRISHQLTDRCRLPMEAKA